MSSNMTGVNTDLDFGELLSGQNSFSLFRGSSTLETELMQSECYHLMLPYIILLQQASKYDYLQSHFKGLDQRLKT